jgi:hypothetical protein
MELYGNVKLLVLIKIPPKGKAAKAFSATKDDLTVLFADNVSWKKNQ